MEACVFGFVHHTHASPTELLDNPVVRDGPADWRLRLSHLPRY